MRSPELHQLVRRGDADGVRELLMAAGNRAKGLVNERDEWNWFPLHHAVRLKPSQPEIVRMLLEAGADPTARHTGPASLKESVLHLALKQATVEVVRLLADYGVDLTYRDSHGYTAAHDACSREEGRSDPSLINLLEYLLSQGVDFGAGSRYGEYPVNSLALTCRFDAIEFLLLREVSADPLQWSPLHRAVALGTLEDLSAGLAANPALESRDRWSRTPFALAVAKGDLAKAELLLSKGADLEAGSSFEGSPLGAAAGEGNLQMMRWLLNCGADVNHRGFMGQTPVMRAVEGGHIKAVELLVEAGAVIDGSDRVSTDVFDEIQSAPMARWLLESGADPRKLRHSGQRVLIGLTDEGCWLDQVDPEEYRRGRSRRFGQANPEEMNDPFWLAMIRDGVNAYAARRAFGDEGRMSCGGEDPVWCADRYGQTITFLPDGRIVQVGGEHEDGYDPDFCIYNDVFVHGPGGSIQVFGYSKEVFPPTDFHTANLVGMSIIIIGCLGYPEQRREGVTPVYGLDIETFAMEAIATTGDNPGWVWGHRAVKEDRDLVLFGGEVWLRGKARGNLGVYRLNLDTLVWTESDEEAPVKQYRERKLGGMMFDMVKTIFTARPR